MDKIFLLVKTFAYILGVVGSIGYDIHFGGCVFAVCMLVVILYSLPEFIKDFKKLIG